MNMRQYFQLTQYSLQSPTVKILVQNRQNLKAKKNIFFPHVIQYVVYTLEMLVKLAGNHRFFIQH